MDRPERPEGPEPPSIFSRPDPDEPTTPRTEPDQRQTILDPLDVSTWGPPTRTDAETAPPLPGRPRVQAADGDRLSPRLLVGLGSAGAIALVLIGFIAFSIFGPGDDPALAAGAGSPTPTARTSAETTISANPESTATPEPTPEPTPAGPPVELAVGDWATVTVNELHVRAGAGAHQASTYRLIRGAVLTVAEGPQVVDGGNWYRVASLGGATGWVSSGWIRDPFLETILNDPTLIRCGEVANPVFDMVDGVPQAREVLRIGDFAMPANKLDEITLASIELARGIRAEVCVTAQVGSDGLPFLRSEPGVSACGHAVPDGQAFWLRPEANQDVEVFLQIKDPALVHPILLSGPVDHRMTSNMRTLLTLMSYDGASGCVDSRFSLDGGGGANYRGANVTQCSIVSVSNDSSIQLRPAAGGATSWVKFVLDGYRPDIPLETPVPVHMSASVSVDGLYADAWLYYSGQNDCK